MSSKTHASSPGGTLIQSGLLVNRAAFGIADRYYWATDVYMLFRDTGAAWEIVGLQPYARRLWTNWYGVVTNNDFNLGVDPGVTQTPLQIEFTCTVDLIAISLNGAQAGNYRAGIYRDNGDTPVGGALLVETASLPPPAGGNTWFEMAIAATRLIRGLYWFAVTTDTPLNQAVASNWPMSVGGFLNGRYFTQVYGALPNPCPAVFTDQPTHIGYVRVVSVP